MQPFFIESPNGNLFGLFYPPAGSGLQHAILHVPAFAEEMNKSRRMVALQARMLSEQGYAVLVFDLFGTGDSEGEFGDATWAIWLQNVDAAVNWLFSQGIKSISLWGLRSGVLLASDYIRQTRYSIQCLLGWQPVYNGDVFITQFLRLRVAASMMNSRLPQEKTSDLKQRLINGEAIEVAGYTLNPDLVKPLLSLSLTASSLDRIKKVAVFEMAANDAGSGSMQALKLIEACQANKQQAALVTCTGSPFWSTQEIAETPDLLTKTIHVIASQLVNRNE